MADKMIQVWVTEHDDDLIQYVVNEKEDMRANYIDIGDEAFTFEDYLDSWISLDIPESILNGDIDTRNEWLSERI